MAIRYEYRPLPMKFRQGGFNFEQLQRQGDVLLLRKWTPEHSSIYFEVVIVRKLEAREIFGKKYPRSEQMPTNEQWGERGWTPFDMESAKKRFDSVVEKTNTSKQPRFTYTKSAKWDEKPGTEDIAELEAEAS